MSQVLTGKVVRASAYKRGVNQLPCIRVDVRLATGEVVPLYHHPRETNKVVTDDFLARAGITSPADFGKDLPSGKQVLVALVSDEDVDKYVFMRDTADEDVLADIFGEQPKSRKR